MKTFSPRIAARLALALAASALTFSALAQDFRIGFVSTDRLLREANQAKSAQTKLEQEFSKREKELQAQAAQLKTASEKFERDAPTMPEAQRVTRQLALARQIGRAHV